MILRRYGQLEAELQPAAQAPLASGGVTLAQLFFVSVGSGLTIWLITRWLERRT
ncbi:MAG: hypothetical protein WC729_29300 [Sphingomonas sp.]|jgi:hypothetical protein|uniref:hypothetical protein n=1 Tax=Sphingomonas sp. TaxID=28214 RepID=UPI00356ABFF5